MGGRANAGNTKMFSNVDAARNAPLRATRAKEIAENRTKTALPSELPGNWNKLSLRERAAFVTGQSVDSFRSANASAIQKYLTSVGSPLSKSLANDISEMSRQGRFMSDSGLLDRSSPFTTKSSTRTISEAAPKIDRAMVDRYSKVHGINRKGAEKYLKGEIDKSDFDKYRK